MRAGRVPPGRRDAPVCIAAVVRAETPLPTRDAAACVRRRRIRRRLARSAVSRGGGRRPESWGGPGGRRGAGWPRASRPPRRARLHAPPSSGRDAAESGGVSCAPRCPARSAVSRGGGNTSSPAPRGTGLSWSYGLGRTGRPYAGFCPAACTAVTAISLGPTLPPPSSGLPEDSASSLSVLCLTLLRARFTERARHPGPWWSLTPPFHPYRRHRRRSALCGTFSRVAPGGCYPPPCSVEPGRSSALPGE